MKACIKEGLRLMPVVSGNMRKTTKEYNLLGYTVPMNVSNSFWISKKTPSWRPYTVCMWRLDNVYCFYHNSGEAISRRSCLELLGEALFQLFIEAYGKIYIYFQNGIKQNKTKYKPLACILFYFANMFNANLRFMHFSVIVSVKLF